MSLATKARIMIGDNDIILSNRKWTDDDIEQYLEASIDDFNACPPATDYTEDNLPSRFRTIIYQGIIVFGCIAYGIFHINKDFNYSENGLSITLDRHSNAMSILQGLGISNWLQMKKDVKKSLIVTQGVRSGFTRVPIRSRYYWTKKYRGIFNR